MVKSATCTARRGRARAMGALLQPLRRLGRRAQRFLARHSAARSRLSFSADDGRTPTSPPYVRTSLAQHLDRKAAELLPRKSNHPASSGDRTPRPTHPPTVPHRRPVFEALESRLLLSVTPLDVDFVLDQIEA